MQSRLPTTALPLFSVCRRLVSPRPSTGAALYGGSYGPLQPVWALHTTHSFHTTALCSASSVDWSPSSSATSNGPGSLGGFPLLQRKSKAGKVIEFDPLARVRVALAKDVPKVFPEINDERLRDILAGTATKRVDPIFRAAYSTKALEYLGDHL